MRKKKTKKPSLRYKHEAYTNTVYCSELHADAVCQTNPLETGGLQRKRVMGMATGATENRNLRGGGPTLYFCAAFSHSLLPESYL